MSEFDDEPYNSGEEQSEVEENEEEQLDPDFEEVQVTTELEEDDIEDDESVEEPEDEEGTRNFEDGVDIYDDSDSEIESHDESSEDESRYEEYGNKVDQEFKKNFMKIVHPQEFHEDYDSIKIMTKVERDDKNLVIDDNHKTFPILTKYEKTRVLGLRISQLNRGAKPFIDLSKYESQKFIDNHIIAESELRQKKLPYIIMRPLPDGRREYWKIEDLEIVSN